MNLNAFERRLKSTRWSFSASTRAGSVGGASTAYDELALGRERVEVGGDEADELRRRPRPTSSSAILPASSFDTSSRSFTCFASVRAFRAMTLDVAPGLGRQLGRRGARRPGPR